MLIQAFKQIYWYFQNSRACVRELPPKLEKVSEFRRSSQEITEPPVLERVFSDLLEPASDPDIANVCGPDVVETGIGPHVKEPLSDVVEPLPDVVEPVPDAVEPLPDAVEPSESESKDNVGENRVLEGNMRHFLV